MSRRDPTAYIKKRNPNNKSGTIKKALDMIQQLDKIKGMMNPTMPESVGASNLASAMSQVASDFSAPVDPEDQKKTTLEAILRKLGPRYGLLVDDVIRFGLELFGYASFYLVLRVPDDTLDRLSQDIRALTEIETVVPSYQTILDNTIDYIKQIRNLFDYHGAEMPDGY